MVVLAEILQADREREIKELVRRRRLLESEPEAPETSQAAARRTSDARTSDTPTSQVRARAGGS